MSKLKLFVPFILALSANLYASEKKPVGWVDDFDGPVKSYSLNRDGARLEVTYFMTLYEEDVITAKEAKTYITIKRSDQKDPITITTKNSPYQLKPLKTDTPFSNVFNWVGSLFNELHENKENITAITAYSRGASTPVSPILEHDNIHLIAGTRQLFIPWSASNTPITLRLSRNGQLIFEQRLELPEDSIGPVELEPGDYVLSLVSESGHQISSPLTVVPKKESPIFRAPQDASGFTGDSAITLKATWLAGQNNGRWSLEAYQMLVPISSSYHPAELLRSGLAQGGVVSID